jgi:feruloyl esterase
MRSLSAVSVGVGLLVSAGAHAQKSCESLANMTLPHARVTHALTVARGAFTLPDNSDAALYRAVPAFCRVQIDATPSPDSDIKIEVWLPVDGWNEKFRGQGNGGFAGEINYSLIGLSVAQGYASAGTDTGHAGSATDAAWALGHPEKIIDFGYRAIHEMTADAKLIVDAYYGKAPARSYFASCSDGGREALMEAQRFPADYDGILAGAPAYPWTNLVTRSIEKSLALTRTPDSYIPASKIPAVAAAVNAACDASDGVKDGVINDPRTCNFKPASLLCKAGPSDSCLTKPQVQTLQTLYAATFDSHGKEIYPRSLPGGEDGPGGWHDWVLGSEPGKSLGFAFGTGYFENMVYDNSHWDYKTFQIDRDLHAAIQKTAAALNATDPNLKPFAARGGKLVLYHGWNDPAISPMSTLQYYDQVQKTNPDSASFVRLFMVPGMQHCYGGPGATSFGQFGWRPGTGPNDLQHNLYLELEDWVEKGNAPEQVIAAKIDSDGKTEPKITMTRPLCAYPMAGKYRGVGDPSNAANFSCVAPAK